MLKRIRNLLRIGPKSGQPEGRAETAAALVEPRRAVEPAVHRGPRIVHSPIPSQDLDPDAVRILERLTRFDHTAYLVGGCVRDLLLGRKPKDFDIGTSATPRQVKRLFSNSRIIGRRFRLAHIYFQSGKILEVATFRAYDLDENGSPGEPGEDLLIREDNVFGSPEEDALRRDFTINALFYDVANGNVLDHADGLGDLRRRLVRTIGDPDVRLREDPIRILRAIKFAARLGFEIEEQTREAIARHRSEIHRAATPRVLEEINRFCRGGAARKSFDLCRSTGVLEVILPEVASYYEGSPTSWPLLLALLEVMDARVERGSEVSTGEIFSALLLPLLGERLGWREDGTVAVTKGIESRDAVEAALRPIALRLRISRKDQERCRLIAQTLHRMVPARLVRRSARQSLAHRPAFADALWLLEAVARARGGEFAEALEFWRRGGEVSPARPEAPGSDVPAGEAAPERKRRRRRRPRKRKPSTETAPATPDPRGAPRDRRAIERPPAAGRPATPWDDDRFFAALPSVPPLDDEMDGSDRYGASEVAAGVPSREEPKAKRAEGEGVRRKRRRRPRRRRAGGAPPPASPAE